MDYTIQHEQIIMENTKMNHWNSGTSQETNENRESSFPKNDLQIFIVFPQYLHEY